MQKINLLKPISVMIVSPQKQKRIRANRFSDFSRHSPQQFSQPSLSEDLFIDDDNMPIVVSDNLRRWLVRNKLQGFLKVVETEPHPNAEALLAEIDVSTITNKKVRAVLEMPRGGFDAVNKVTEDVLRSYFGEYSPSAKAYQTQGGRDVFFHEVAKFLLEVGFVSPRFYCMPKKRAGFIIAAYEGEAFDWGLLSADALREQLNGVQKGKPMKPIFARWLSVLFPTSEPENRSEVRRPPQVQSSRTRRQVQREEWREEEST